MGEKRRGGNEIQYGNEQGHQVRMNNRRENERIQREREQESLFVEEEIDLLFVAVSLAVWKCRTSTVFK